MKLRTEMHGSDCFFKDGPKDTQHDAMAAHALLQAMDDVRVGLGAYENPSVEEIKQRAAEILAGWIGDRG